MLYARHLLKRDKDGRFGIARAARGVMPYKMTIDAINNGELPLVVPAAPGVIGFNFRAPNYDAGRSIFEGTDWSFSDQTDTTAASGVLILLKDLYGREFMNDYIHIRTFAGTGRLPAVMREPMVLPANQKFDAKAQKVTGGAASIRPYCNGTVYWPSYFGDIPELTEITNRLKKRLQYFQPYWLTTESAVSLTSLQNNVNFDIRIGFNLEIFGVTAVTTAGDFAVEFTELRSNQTLMNGRVSQLAGIGDARYPTIFDQPWLIPSGSILRLTFQNLASETNKVYLTFWCRRILVPLERLELAEAETDIDLPLQALEKQLVGAA